MDLRKISCCRSRSLLPVHTNRCSNENRAFLLRIRLSSTLQRRKRSPKTEPFENALQSGAIWKRCFLGWAEKTMLSESGGVIKTDTTRPQITRLWLSKMSDRFYHVASIMRQFRGPIYEMRMRWVDLSMRREGIKAFKNGYGVVVWTGQNDTKTIRNDKCGGKSFWKRSRTAPFSFENGLTWAKLSNKRKKRHKIPQKNSYVICLF